MATIAELSGSGSTGPGIQQVTEITGSSGDPSGADTVRTVVLSFTNGDGDAVEVTFKVATQNGVETDFLWPFDSSASLTITVQAEEV